MTSNEQLPSEEIRFATNASGLADALVSLTTKLYQQGYAVPNPNVISLAACLVNSWSPVSLIEGFIRRSHIHWDKILVRNRQFFVRHAGDIFCEIPVENVNMFASLFSQEAAGNPSFVTPEKEEQFWEYFEAMVKIAIKYVHKKRVPYSYSEQGRVVTAYQQSFFDEIDTRAEAVKWKIHLDFPSG